MNDWSTKKPLLHRALEAQGFRQVPIAELIAAPFHLPGVDANIDAALNPVRHNENWVEIVRQLAQLKVRAFNGLHLRRDERDLEVVPIFAWSGQVNRKLVEDHVNWVYPIVKRIQGSLEKFKLSDQELALINAAATSAKLTHPVAASLLQIVVDAHTATMPNTTALFVDTDGVSADLASDFDRLSPSRSNPNPFSIGNRPVVFSAAVDGVTGAIHGYNDVFSLNLKDLSKSFSFLAANG